MPTMSKKDKRPLLVIEGGDTIAREAKALIEKAWPKGLIMRGDHGRVFIRLGIKDKKMAKAISLGVRRGWL